MLKTNIKMAEIEELKQMVLSFRRAELIELLGFVGLNKMGVKATLLQRAVSLIQSQRGCSMPVQIKIRELYRSIHNPYASENTRTRASVRNQQLADARRRFPTNKAPPAPSDMTVTSRHVPQSQSGAVDYSSPRVEAPVLPVHPDVSFKRLPFYDIMGELLRTNSLVPRGTSRYQETYFVFHLTPQQAQDIAMSRDFRPNARCEYTVQIQLRFCFLETSCEQDDNFPPSICVRVNGKMAQLPNPIPTTKPGVEPKRPGRPVDITSLCRISPTMPNHIEISWASEYGRGYCVSINLVKRLTSDILLARLKQFGNRHADHTRALIKEKLHLDPDSEIATTSLRVSLMCPLGKMRMTLPARAGTCTHLQCFDAITFLMMNEKKPTWTCPVCDKPAPFHKLIIDGLFVEILKKVVDVDEIQFLEDGSWSPMRHNKETHLISSPVVKAASSNCTDTMDCTTSPPKKPKVEVIDLTETDSEDEQEPRPASSQAISSGDSSPAVIQSTTPLSPVSSPDHTSLINSPSFSVPSLSLPPLPSLVSYQSSVAASASASLSSSSTSTSLSSSSSLSSHSSHLSHALSKPSTSYPHSNGNFSSSSRSGAFSSVDSTPAWLQQTLGGGGQKRPPPAHSGSQPPHKRVMLEKPSTPSSNSMSPLVDLDQLCSLLDADRSPDDMSSLFSLPADFPIAGPSSSGNNSRNIFNISPSDIISLD